MTAPIRLLGYWQGEAISIGALPADLEVFTDIDSLMAHVTEAVLSRGPRPWPGAIFAVIVRTDLRMEVDLVRERVRKTFGQSADVVRSTICDTVISADWNSLKIYIPGPDIEVAEADRPIRFREFL